MKRAFGRHFDQHKTENCTQAVLSSFSFAPTCDRVLQVVHEENGAAESARRRRAQLRHLVEVATPSPGQLVGETPRDGATCTDSGIFICTKKTSFLRKKLQMQTIHQGEFLV